MSCTVEVNGKICGLPQSATIHTLRFGHTYQSDDPMHTPIPELDMDEQKDVMRVFCYFVADEKLYVYRWTEDELQKTVDTFPEIERIYFVLTPMEIRAYLQDFDVDNLTNDFIWFKPSLRGRSQVICTCGRFSEASNDFDQLARRAVRHFKRTGHTLNPRGN